MPEFQLVLAHLLTAPPIVRHGDMEEQVLLSFPVVETYKFNTVFGLGWADALFA
jgi:hypothetical protein